MINNASSGLKSQIEDEIRQYTTELVNISEAYDYSQFKLVRRITLFEGHTYPTGKFDTQGNYKMWYDGISSRISNEVKNIDFDTKDIIIYSDRSSDDLAVLIANLKLKEYLRETGQDEELNSAVEEGSGWGNIVWKKTKKGYERVDLKNFYVINQTAQCLDETPVIERHQMTSSDLRAKIGVWENVEAVLKQNKTNTFQAQIQSSGKQTTIPYYDVYERNGEVSVKDLKEARGEQAEDGDSDKYVFAKVISAGSKGTSTGVSLEYILFAQELPGKDNSDLYVEFHRGLYKGKWFREGMYELLFDLQVRLNMIGNQLAQGLELASKIILVTEDKLVVQNILTDMKNGDIIRAKNLQAINLSMPGFQQLVEEWNLIQQQMNDIANSSPIVTGEGLPQRMPFQVAALLNQNSNKLFDYFRQKLGIAMVTIFEEWIIPQLVKNLSAQDILRLTGDEKMLSRLYQMIVDDWYLNNLIAIGPHGQEIADFLKAKQLDELQKRPALLMASIKEKFKDFEPSVSCVITGENSTLPQDMQTLSTFIALEQDPIRRTALIEMAMKKKGIDVASLPKSPEQGQPPAGGSDSPQPGGNPPLTSTNTAPTAPPPKPQPQKRPFQHLPPVTA